MTGVVTISVEIELGWGMHDKKSYSHLSSDGVKETNTLRKFLNLCDELDIPISFDVVGHLLEDSCNGHHEGDYPDGWWDEDPGTNPKEDPLFYAPELIKEINRTETDHEICTHTYSHFLAAENPPELLDQELQHVQAAHEKAGLPAPRSIVLPRHSHGKYSVLAANDIDTIRRPIEEYWPDFSTPISNLFWHFTRSHPSSELIETEGVLETTCTPHPSLTAMFLPQGQRSEPHSAFRLLPQRARKYLHKRYLVDAFETAATNDDHVHLWTHLHNMANEVQWSGVEYGLRHLSSHQANGDVEVKPMEKLSTVAR